MLNSSKAAKLMVALLCGSALCTSVAFAEQTDGQTRGGEAKEFSLAETVVTASRVEKKRVDTPANVTVVDAKTIEERNYQDILDILQDVPGASVITSGFRGSEQHVTINGEERILFLVNGHRVNLTRGGGHARQAFDIRSLPGVGAIERVEIVKNASTSLYGSDAVGGVINVITKRGAGTSVKADIGAGSWGKRKYAINGGGSTESGFSAFISAEKTKQKYTKFKDTKTHDTLKWDADYDFEAVSVRLDQEIGEDQLATLTFDHTMTDAGQPYSYRGNGQFYPSAIGATGTMLDNNVTGKYEWGLSGDNNGYIQLYLNNNEGNLYQTASHSNYTEKAKGISAQQHVKLFEGNNLTFGYEYNNSKIENKGTYKEHSLITQAFFLQDEWEFVDSWQLNAGWRYDHHNYFGHKNTGSVSLNKKFNETSHAYVSFNQVFNAPQGNDLFWPYSNAWGFEMGGDENLKPETGHVVSLGYEAELSDKTHLNVAYSRSSLKDAIRWNTVFNPDWTGRSFVENIDRQKKHALELSVDHRFSENWKAWASYVYVKVENDGGTGTFARDETSKPNLYNFGVQYENDKWNVNLLARGANGLSRKQYASSGYLTADLTAQYKVNKNISVYGSVYNLFNAAYADKYGINAADGSAVYPMPSRSFFVGVQYAF